MATPPTLFSLPPEIKIIIAKMVALQDEVFNINDNWEGLGELERKQRGRAATTLSGQSASALSKTCKAWHAILVPFLFEASQTLSSSKVHHFDRLFLAELLPKYLSHFKTFALDSPTTEPRFLIALSYVLLLPNLVCLRLDRQHLVSLHLFARTSAFRAIAPRITGLEITSYDNYSELLNGFVNLTSLELSNSLDSNVELQVSRDQLAQAPKLTHLTREQGVTVRTSLADPWYSFDDYSKAEERLALKFRYDTIKRLTGFVESEAGRQMLQNDVVGSNQLVDALEGVIGYRYLYED
ncbi:hypothetical protein MNV49_005323 [Pseudohyphozyma bogoriensis]|nr:hypothetical protein MNV49_005323 [Pseudohyphozyma bogoriensis]